MSAIWPGPSWCFFSWSPLDLYPWKWLQPEADRLSNCLTWPAGLVGDREITKQDACISVSRRSGHSRTSPDDARGDWGARCTRGTRASSTRTDGQVPVTMKMVALPPLSGQLFSFGSQEAQSMSGNCNKCLKVWDENSYAKIRIALKCTSPPCRILDKNEWIWSRLYTSVLDYRNCTRETGTGKAKPWRNTQTLRMWDNLYNSVGLSCHGYLKRREAVAVLEWNRRYIKQMQCRNTDCILILKN